MTDQDTQPADTTQTLGEVAQRVVASSLDALIERAALDASTPMEKLESLIKLAQQREEKAAKIAFATALSAARGELPPILKNAEVDFDNKNSKGKTQYKYETLAGIAKEVDPILSRHGLSYRFCTRQADGRVQVSCILAHSSGYEESTSLAAGMDNSGNKNGFQALGSAVTYLERYTLKAALGISVEKDDDGQAAGKAAGKPAGAETKQGQTRQTSQKAPESKPASAGKPAVDDEFTQALAAAKTPDDINALLGKAKEGGKDMSKALVARAREMGLAFDRKEHKYIIEGDLQDA